MEPALIQLQSQIEKLPLDYEWAFRVFINRTMPYVATYKMLATRMLELRYGIAKYKETPVTREEEKKLSKQIDTSEICRICEDIFGQGVVSGLPRCRRCNLPRGGKIEQ